MFQEENLQELSQSLSTSLVKRNLKRWFSVNADKDTSFLIKTKHKKTEKRIKSNSYSDDDLQFFYKEIINQFPDRNHSVLWLHTVQHQMLERPIFLTGPLSSLCPFKIYLKCLPSTKRPQEISRVQATSFIKMVQDSVNFLNFTKLNVEDIYQWINVQFNSNCLEIKVIEQDSNSDISSTSNMMLWLKSDLISAIDFAITLYCKIHSIKPFDVSTDNTKPCIEKMLTMKQSESNSYYSNNHNSSEKLSIFKSDDLMNLKKHTELESSKIIFFYSKNILTGSENLQNATKDDLIVQSILAHSETKLTKPLCQSKRDAEIYDKQFKERLVENVTFPLIKFNLDFEEISGSSEMFLSTIMTQKSQNEHSDADITICANKPCLSAEEAIKNDFGSKTIPMSDISDSNIVQEGSKESQDTILNSKNTQSSSQKCTKSLFSETPIFPVQDYKELLSQESGNHYVPNVMIHTSESEEIEHVVPDINTISNQSMVETFMYEEYINSKGLKSSHYQQNMKSSQSTSELEEKSITAFHWCNRSLNLECTDVSVSDQFSYPPVQQCSRPLRLGLSKKQRVKQLHKK